MIKEIQAKSILRKHEKIESWFMSRYGMNMYRGCTHNCAYCDGRAEGYYVDGEFGKNVEAKINALDVLSRELDPKRKRIPMKKGFVMVGGGGGDGYQPIEEKYRMTRQVLQLLHDQDFPVHILTKSVLVESDIDLLVKINRKTRALISMSFSSLDDAVSKIFEPGVPSPTRRIETLKRFKDRGFMCGMFLMPVIPYVTDTEEKMDEALRRAKSIGIDFIIFSGMTLKDGRQKEFFMNTLRNYDPSLIPAYRSLYLGDKWGGANGEYYETIHKVFYQIAKQYRILIRIPVMSIKECIDADDQVIAILEHLDYLLKFRNQKSSLGRAAQILSDIKEPLSRYIDPFRSFRGVTPEAEKIISEILDTGQCKLYSRLLSYDMS